MAARKRRASTHRRRHHRAAVAHNPKRRRTTARRHRRHSVFARRHHNPTTRRRHHRRRRNPRPSFAGTGGEIINFAFAGLGLGIFQPLVQRTVGGYLSALGQYQAPVVTAGSGYLLSWIFDFFGPTKRLARPTLILGFSTAVIQIVSPWVRGLLGGGAATANPTMAAPMYRRGLRGIAAVPTTVPAGMPLQAPAAAPAASGMHGIASYPAVGSFMRR